MLAKDFLAVVLPEEGWYCVTGLKKGAPLKKYYQTLDEVEEAVDELLQKEYDVYFSCTKFKESGTSTTENAEYFKAFRLDIDCGKGKPYDSQGEGVQALVEFCTQLKLPIPLLVNSGRGIHVYWALSETITKTEWKPLADKLKSLCLKYRLHADHAITADAARILRIPGTLNFKTDPPLPVAVMREGEVVSLEEFKKVLDAVNVPVFPVGQVRPSDIAADPNIQYRFANILEKNQNGNGCHQIQDIIENRESITYNQWFYALSIAKFCVDADQAIHIVSQDHPDYTPEAAVKKANDIHRWTSCKRFEEENPGGCKGCSHKKIGTPLKLAAEVKVSNKKELIVEQKVGEIVHTVTYDIPELPYPFVVGDKEPGIYKLSHDEEEGPILVYPHNLFVLKRMNDPQKGMCAWLRLVTPLDGVVEFILPMAEMSLPVKFKERLAYRGIVGSATQMELVTQYIVACCNKLMEEKEAETMRIQFGWADNDSRFIVGTREIGADSIKYSPPCSATEHVAEMMEPKGTLEEWRKVINVYNTPGFEPHAFAFASALGAPLLKHMGFRGCAINLISENSGTGKTTILKAINSFVGNPIELLGTFEDTHNFKMNRMGMLNNICYTCDEITNIEAREFSDFVYSASNGRVKGRMKAQENAERTNQLQWATIAVTTANASFYDKLKLIKQLPEGEMMRVIEYEILPNAILDKETAEELFSKLNENHGVAADIYFSYIVGNLEAAVQLAREIQKKIDKAAGLQNRERHWSAVAACNIAGLAIGTHLGIFTIDAMRVMKWVIELLKDLKSHTAPPLSAHSTVIAEFLTSHLHNVLVINNEALNRNGLEQMPIQEPRQELMVRYEPDTKKMYINTKALQNYCAKQQTNMKELLTKLETDKIYLGTVKKRMAKGTKVAAPPMWAYEFDCNNSEFIDPDAYVASYKNEAA